MTLDTGQRVADVALDHPECVPIFQKHRIDFCCGGKATLAEASLGSDLPPTQLVHELEEAIAERARSPDADPRTMDTAALVELIVTRYHHYLRQALPVVQGLATKVARVHGEHNPRLVTLSAAVNELAETLSVHIDEEERALFPALTANHEAALVREDVLAMEQEHQAVGKLLGKIRSAAEDFHAPDWACTSYRTLFSELETLEEDVKLHVHLENNVLAPRFIG